MPENIGQVYGFHVAERAASSAHTVSRAGRTKTSASIFSLVGTAGSVCQRRSRPSSRYGSGMVEFSAVV